MDLLRHPYARRNMLISSMMNHQEKQPVGSQGRGGAAEGRAPGSRDDLGPAKGADMNALVFANHEIETKAEPRAMVRDRLANAQSLGAVFGLAGGVLAGLLGALLTAACWFVADAGAHHLLSEIGTALFFMTIPLIIFGGYCMDWMEKDRSRQRSGAARYEDGDEDGR
jgi:hypothetical protein